MPGCTIIHPLTGVIAAPRAGCKWLGLVPVALVYLVVGLLACIPLANVTIFGFVNHPLHVVNAPVECFGAHLFLFRFIVLGRCLLPLLILFLKALVCPVLLVSVIARISPWHGVAITLCSILLASLSLVLMLSSLTLSLTLLELVDELW